MFFAADFREQARSALRGKWKKCILLMLLANAAINGFGLSLIGDYFFSNTLALSAEVSIRIPQGAGIAFLGASLLLMLIAVVVNVGQFRMANSLLDGGEAHLKDILPMRAWLKAFVVYLLQGLLILVPAAAIGAGTLLLQGLSGLFNAVSIISMLMPIIMIAVELVYGMAFYLIAKDPAIGPVRAMRESRKKMRGHKMEFFVLTISFFGWSALYAIAVLIANENLFPQDNFFCALGSLIVQLIGMAILQTYTSTAYAAFYRRVENPVEEAGRPVFTWGESAEANPDDGIQPPPDPSPAANEPAARDLFFAHGCSRRRMREAGVLEEYENCRADFSAEHRWVQEQGNLLMQRFSSDPSALNDLLDHVSEYELTDLLDRAIERISRHVRQETLPGHEIFAMLGRILVLADSGIFAERENYVSRKKLQLADIGDRLSQHMRESDPDGDWRHDAELLEKMCRE